MPASPLKIWMKRIGAAVGGLLVLLAAALGAFYLYLQTDSGRNWLAGRLEASLSDALGAEVHIRALSGNPLSRFSIDRISAAEPDSETPFLVADGLQAHWRPWALWSDTLAIAAVELDALVLQPAPAPETDRPFAMPALPSIPALPFNLAVADIRIGEIRFRDLAPAALDGRLLWQRGGGIDSQLILTPTESEDRAQLDIQFDPAQHWLDVDIALVAPPGGLLSALLPARLMERRSTLSITGKGPTEDWDGRVSLSFDNEEAMQGSLGLTGTDSRTDLVLSLSATPDFLRGMGLQELAEAALILDLGIGLEGRRPVSLRAELHHQDSFLRLGGDLTRGSAAPIQINAELSPPYPAALAGLFNASSLTAEGQLFLPDRRVSLDLRARDFAASIVSAPLFETAITARQSGADVEMGVEVRAPAVQIRTGEPPMALADFTLAGEGRYDAGLDRIVIDRLNSEADGVDIALSGHVEADAQQGALDGRLRIADLAAWQSLTGTPFRGRADVAIGVRWPDGPAAAGADVKLAFTGFESGVGELDGLLGGSPEAVLQLVRQGNTDRIDLAIEGANATLTSAITAEDDFARIRAPFDLSIADVNPLLAGAPLAGSGQLAIAGTVAGPLETLGLEAQLTMPRLTLNRLHLDDLTLSLSASDIAGAPAGRLALSGLTDGKALSGGVTLSQENGAVLLDPIELTAPDFSITGRLRREAGGLPGGALALSVESLASIGRMAGTAMNGKARLDIALKPEEDIPVRITGQASDLDIWPSEARAWEAETVDIDLGLDPRTAFPRLEGRLAVSDLRNHAARFESAVLQATPQDGGVRVALSLDGRAGGPVSLQSQAYLRPGETAGFTLTLESLDGTAAGKAIALGEPFPVVLHGDGDIEAGPLALRVADGSLRGRFARRAGEIDLNIDADALNLAVLSPALTWGTIEGRFDGRIALETRQGLPYGEFNATLEEFALGDVLARDSISVSAEGALKGDRLTLSTVLRTPDPTDLELKLDLPLQRSAAEGVRPDRNRAFSAALEGRLDVEPLWPLTGKYTHRLRGMIEADLTAAGTLDAPELNGRLALSGAHYRHLISGLSGSAERIDLKLRGSRVLLDQVQAKGPEGGPIAVDGWVEPFAPEGARAEIRIDIAQALLIDRREAKIRGRATIDYRRAAQKAHVSGNATIIRAELKIPESPAPDLVQLEIREINKGDAPEARVDEMPMPVETSLDYSLKAANQIFVRGQGLDSEWKGDIAITGTLQKPVLSGSVNLVRGTYEILGKRFKLLTGQLSFLGRTGIDPEISATAEHQSKGITVNVRISGPVSKPQIALSSTPTLPEDEIIARLLFGTERDRLSALQAAQLAAAAASLGGGGGGGFDPIGGVRRTLQLDYLEIGATEEGVGTVRSGKYLSNNVYVEVETAPAGSETTARVDVDLTNRLSVGTSTSSQGASTVRLKWQWNY